MSYEKFARKLAAQSEFSRARIGAVITKGGRVLSTGINERKYTKRNGRSWPSIHAEEAAILKILKEPNGQRKLIGATIYVSRIKKDGTPGLAKPCKDCQALINAVGIKRVFYTEDI